MPRSRPSDRVAELVRAGARRVLAAPSDLFDMIDSAALAEHDPAVGSDPSLLATFRRANRATILHWAQSNVNDPGGEVKPFAGYEALALARDLVRRGFDARALESYRAAQNVAWQVWMEIAFTLTDDAEELRELLRVTAASIFAYVDATNVGTIQQIGREREELVRGGAAERLETVTLVLESAPIDLDRAARRLGYEFSRTHLAAIVWTDEAAADALRFAQVAEAVAASVGGRRPLTVTASSTALWVWTTASDEPSLDEVERILAGTPGVRVALGSRRHGVDGFRRSHFDAYETQRVVARLGSPLQLACYDAVKVVSLATQDPRRAAAFVAETLGDFAHAPPVLRETLRTYLHLQSSTTRAAEALFTHRNTIVGRLAKAQDLLPNPLDSTAFDVGVALEILHWGGGYAGIRP